MAQYVKHELPFILAGLVTLFTIFEYYLDIPALSSLVTEIQFWSIAIAASVFALGLLNITAIHTKSIQRRVSGKWQFSVWLLIVMWFTFFAAVTTTPIGSGPMYTWLYHQLYVPVSTAIGTLPAFFIAGATYRTVRAKNFDSAVILAVVVFVMLTNAPIGGAIWKGIPVIGTWLMDVPTTAGMRGFTIAAAMGAVLLALRVILGKEEGALGG